jgi:predicted aspartyl protease
MGITYIEGLARGFSGQEEAVEFLVDSGAGYTLLPYGVWQSLGLEATREERFRLADGTAITRNMSRCYLVFPQGEDYSPVILGEPGDDQALLGVVTLEILGLVLNPFSRTLHSMHLLL